MAVASFTALVYNGLVPPLDMALLAFSLYMFPFQLVSPVFGRVMPEKGRLPTLDVMAGVAFPVLELLLVRVTVTGGRIAGLKWYPLDLAVFMALGAGDLNMLIGKRVLGLVMVDLYLFPALCCVAVLAQRFTLMDILMAGDALLELLDLILFFFVTLDTLDIDMFAG